MFWNYLKKFFNKSKRKKKKRGNNVVASFSTKRYLSSFNLIVTMRNESFLNPSLWTSAMTNLSYGKK